MSIRKKKNRWQDEDRKTLILKIISWAHKNGKNVTSLTAQDIKSAVNSR